MKTLRYFLLATFVMLAVTVVARTQQEKKDSGSKKPDSPPAAGTDSRDAVRAATYTVVIYYFYMEPRCISCKNIEQFTREAIEEKFAPELKSGRLFWLPVDVKSKGNWRYVEDFQISSKSVIAAVYKSKHPGEESPVEWKNLERIWELLKNKPEFMKYIQEETRVFLLKYAGKEKKKEKKSESGKKRK